MRTTLLTLHLIGVAAWLGGNLTQLTLLPLFERGGHAVAAAWHMATGQMARFYYSIAGTLVFLTGIGLVSDSGYSYGDPFVSIGFAVVIISFVLGITLFGPQAQAAKKAHEAQDSTSAQKHRRTIVVAGLFDTLILLIALWAMVEKVGI